MQPGKFITDVQRKEQRFRIKSLLASGKHYQIALAEDTRLEDKLVCVKTIEYDGKYIADEAYILGRRKALWQEMQFLTLETHLLPEPFDWIQSDESAIGRSPEPVLVYEYQHGETLQELISTKHPDGLAPKRALRIFKELVRFAGTLHEQKHVFRDFDPRHIIIGFDDIIHVVGCGNAVERGEEMNVYKMNTNPRYTAPEIRRELSGKVVRPACDFYSLGCLLSYMLTGYEPTPVAEAPLQPMAYKRLKSDEFPDGLRLLIARCLQPLAQKRFSSAKKLLPFCAPSSVPDAQTEGFGLMDLPAPWSGPGASTPSDVKPLSPGPLVITKSPQPQAQPQAAPQEAPQDAMVPKPSKELKAKSSNVGLWVGVGLVGMLVLIVIIGLVGAVVMGIMG